MSEQTEPNLFSKKVKLLVGGPLLVVAVVYAAHDPQQYIAVVGALTMLVAVAYPLLYSRLPWKDTVLGRALMTHARSVALLYVVGVFGTYYDYPFHGYVMAFVTSYLAVGITFQFVVLLRILDRAEKKRLNREASHEQNR